MASSKKPSPNPDRFEAALDAALDRAAAAGRPLATAIGVAFSGGADSMLLLETSAALSRKRPLRVVALHINHGLSPNALVWARFARDVAKRLEVEFHVASLALTPSAGESIEASARAARYDALETFCARLGLPILLTAHHSDDQAETVLLNLARGTGVTGLRGIAARRELGHTVLLRPFLEFRAADIRNTLLERKLTWIEDESNSEQRFRRNTLRHRVIPPLTEAFPGAIEQLSSAARWAVEAQQLLDERGLEDLSALNANEEGLDLAAWRELNYPRASNALRCWFRRFRGHPPNSRALEDMLERFWTARPHRGLEFVLSGERWDVEGARLRWTRQIRSTFAVPSARTFQWQGERVWELPEWHGRVVFTRVHDRGPSATWLRATPLTARARKGAERLRLAAGRPSRSLKNLYQESGIHPDRRARLPLLFAGDALLFAAGLGSDVRLHGTSGEELVSLEWQEDSDAMTPAR